MAQDRRRARLTRRPYDAVTMLVLDLSCAAGHLFEGWFGSSDDYESQRERGLLSCPVCGAQEVRRLPSAPRLNVSGLREPGPVSASAVQSAPPETAQQQQLQLQGFVMQAMREVLARTEDVGERFAEEARRIHYGEAEERGIRGRTSAEEARALAEEGIELFALPELPGSGELQ